jgi:hypothetical protein
VTQARQLHHVCRFFPNQLTERPEETAYVMQLARLRHRAIKYLQEGTFLRPPELRVPSSTLPLSRLSIYAGQQGAVQSFEGRYPLVQAGAWRAPDGDVAIALASIADNPVTVPLALDREVYSLPRRGQLYCLTRSNRVMIGEFSGHRVAINIQLAPREACLVELEGRR